MFPPFFFGGGDVERTGAGQVFFEDGPNLFQTVAGDRRSLHVGASILREHGYGRAAQVVKMPQAVCGATACDEH
ncbi:hypothetical protein KKP04_14195 [Rhodomicrobium sp. Az07]|uniref:hypothetical protein n=1 Tax=Rhodomicrobium sp. Az07 TaxID=2839034 RepID=UPI001BED38AC|nr:hypothetical protein [Rhodomicrobium sp. Az07]